MPARGLDCGNQNAASILYSTTSRTPCQPIAGSHTQSLLRKHQPKKSLLSLEKVCCTTPTDAPSLLYLTHPPFRDALAPSRPGPSSSAHRVASVPPLSSYTSSRATRSWVLRSLLLPHPHALPGLWSQPSKRSPCHQMLVLLLHLGLDHPPHPLSLICLSTSASRLAENSPEESSLVTRRCSARTYPPLPIHPEMRLRAFGRHGIYHLLADSHN